MCRTSTAAAVTVERIYLESDHICIPIPRHKGDQEGINATPKSLYSNPEQPEVCVFLALALRIFSTSFYEAGRPMKLFSGGNVEGTFSRWLAGALASGDLDAHVLGVNPGDVGSHSIRQVLAGILKCSSTLELLLACLYSEAYISH